jgi:GNAT superfamily N-acetyltransferase
MTEGGGSGLVLAAADFLGEPARSLVARLDADLDERYAADDEAEGEPDHEILAIPPEQVVPPQGTFLVAWLDGRPVGCGALRPAPTGEPGSAEVKRMYVAPEARRRGVSRVVLAGLEDAARDLGYRRVILETGVRQPEAMALYESAGYTPIESYGGYRGSPLSRCFEKRLE